jgi:DUF1680 family protein
MYAASEVTWDRPSGAVEVVQETDYPSKDSVRLTVRKPGNGAFAMKLRIPAWTKDATLLVNGKPQAVTPGTLAVVNRRWKAGDTLDLVMPQPLRTLPIDDRNPHLAAVMRGPVMYVGINPWAGIETQAIALPGALEPMPNSDVAYRTQVGARNLVFIPYFNVDTERSTTYFKIA